LARTRSTITSRAVRGRRAAAVRENPMAGLVSKASTGVRAQQAFSSPSATSRLSRNSSSHIHALLLVHDQASPVCSPSAPCRPDAFGPLGLVPGDGCERAPRSGAFAGVTLAGPRRDPVGSQPRNLQRWAWKRQRRSSEGACRPDLDARRPKGEARTAAGRGDTASPSRGVGGARRCGQAGTHNARIRPADGRARAVLDPGDIGGGAAGEGEQSFSAVQYAGPQGPQPGCRRPLPPKFSHEGVDRNQLADVHQQHGHDRTHLRCDGDARIRPGGARMQGAENPALNSLAVPLPAALEFLRPNASRDPSVPVSDADTGDPSRLTKQPEPTQWLAGDKGAWDRCGTEATNGLRVQRVRQRSAHVRFGPCTAIATKAAACPEARNHLGQQGFPPPQQLITTVVGSTGVRFHPRGGDLTQCGLASRKTYAWPKRSPHPLP